MKKILLLVLLFAAINLSAQNNTYTVTMNGIGGLKIGMLKPALEKVLGTKIKLKNLLDAEAAYQDTIKTKYKNIDVQLYLERRFVDQDTFDIILAGVRTSSPLCKTSSGISIGTDKIKVINTYENNMISMWPEYEDEGYTRRSKTRSLILVSADDSDNTIIFYLNNKKVVAFEVVYYEGD